MLTLPQFQTVTFDRYRLERCLADCLKMFWEYRDRYAKPGQTDENLGFLAICEIMQGLDAEADLIAHGEESEQPGRRFNQ